MNIVLGYRRKIFFVMCAMLFICWAIFLVFSKNEEIAYSFIVAGHTYGSPGTNSSGLHPPFKDNFDFINKKKTIALAFFTGDIVRKSNSDSWDRVDNDISKLNFPVHFAPGNHDRASQRTYLERYGVNNKSYYSFEHANDLFVVLDGNLAGWSITGEQLAFLAENLSTAQTYDNIFIFVHQIIWWDEREVFRTLNPNSKAGRKEPLNFWPALMPIFEKLSNSVYVFAGDTGAFPNYHPSYFRYKNVNLVASGMGGGDIDNFLIVERLSKPRAGIRIWVKWLNQAEPVLLPSVQLEATLN